MAEPTTEIVDPNVDTTAVESAPSLKVRITSALRSRKAKAAAVTAVAVGAALIGAKVANSKNSSDSSPASNFDDSDELSTDFPSES